MSASQRLAGYYQTLDDNGILDKWPVGRLADEWSELIREDWQAVAAVDNEHGSPASLVDVSHPGEEPPA
jgi:hypothetical protein